MSTITAPARGFRMPVLLMVLAFVAAAIIAGVAAFALSSESDDTQAPARDAPAVQPQEQPYVPDFISGKPYREAEMTRSLPDTQGAGVGGASHKDLESYP